MTARAYEGFPSRAWRELGYPELSARGRRRLTLACTELLAVRNALREMTRKRTKDDPAPDPEDVRLAAEIDAIYREVEEPKWEAAAEATEAAD